MRMTVVMTAGGGGDLILVSFNGLRLDDREVGCQGIFLQDTLGKASRTRNWH